MTKTRRTSRRRANVTVTEESKLPDMLRKLEELAAKEVHVGAAGDAELAMIAGIHEYGSIKAGIPARSFIGSGRKKASAAVSKLVRTKLQDLAEGSLDAESFLKQIGDLAQQSVLKNFDRIRTPPLSPIYARRKGSRKILVQEQELRDSITYLITGRKRR
ncbi:phage virion morphogenesis protein [Paenibacillus caseinilyticus]|uniref:hypothetical protein n=1 Tax=Paenibacillus caseinilyticus TaxID=3098138 RepID=UPI0022B89BA6|nr:hypothetical protein [Paenibacillus caseinilyticus]MCZ8518881.1 hypothetical protein [Paenibacillus caseinilyticus]